MSITQILSQEHRVIEVVLGCLEKMTGAALARGRLNKEAAEQALDFIKNFADRCHHGKEEDHLFPAMEEKGVPRHGGPVGMMLHEHEQGRLHVQGMAMNLEEAAQGDRGALEKFAESADNYIQLLRAHIRKEDGVLFPIADKIFSDKDQGRLETAFQDVEKEDIGSGVHERYLEIARNLANSYGLSTESIPTTSCGCGH